MPQTPASTDIVSPGQTAVAWPPRWNAGRLSDLSRLVFAPDSGSDVPVEAPAFGVNIGSVAETSPGGVARAFARSREAQEKWRLVPVKDRCRILMDFHHLVLKNRDDLMDLVQLETGKARRDAFEEFADLLNNVRFTARRSPRLIRTVRKRSIAPGIMPVQENRHPLGAVGVISPWNYPLTLALSDAVAALAAGNSVVLKPSELTPFTALRLRQLIDLAGLPSDLLLVVNGPGESTGRAVVQSADGLCFTGSTAVGREVGRTAAERLIPATLELGGKNPMIVCEDADLERALPGAVRACFANSGQLCISIERLFVHRSIYGEFLDGFVARSARLCPGFSYDYGTDYGSLISGAHLARVESRLSEALGAGARILHGGTKLEGHGPYFFAPSIIENVPPSCRLFSEETFGPVVALYPFETEDQAIAAANDSNYGFSASVWSRDAKRARQIAARLACGTVNVNEGYGSTWFNISAPLGGMKDSGTGYRHGDEGILRFVQRQIVAEQRFFPVTGPEKLGPERFAALTSRVMKIAAFLRR